MPETRSLKWLPLLLAFLRETIQTVLAAMLSRERLKRQRAEQALKIEKQREQINEDNKRYHDAGKRGLLERLRQLEKTRSDT
nr:hypothetical protein 4 [Coxiellaceae bacterium]